MHQTLSATHQEWDAFIQDPREAMDPVRVSWLRALRAGLMPDQPTSQRVDDLGSRRQRLLKRAAVSDICGRASDLATAGFAVLLSDADGVLLEVGGCTSMARALINKGVVPGTHWHERARGTNAIGEVLHSGQPVEVIGAAHFQRGAHTLACYAAPIRDAAGNMLGVIDATTWVERAHPLAPGAILTAAASVRTRDHPCRPVHLGFASIAGQDAQAAATVQRAVTLARTRIPVLITGETGTGKDLLARAIHQTSAREGTLVAFNAGSLHDELAEAELFGTADGAFTGARRGGRAGLLEAAHRGTLLLDEVAELSPRAQAMLLRFLDDGSFRRVGCSRERRVDVRIICATWKDLQREVDENRFRKDLYYRLRGVSLRLPPLRARSDRMALAQRLLQDLSPGDTLTKVERQLVMDNEWAGNIRELKAALQLRAALGPGSLTPDVFPCKPAVQGSMLDAERQVTVNALRQCGGNRAAAARKLGIARSTLYRLIERHGL